MTRQKTTAKRPTKTPIRREIVVGTDGSATATVAVRRAGEIARAEGATLHIVTAFESFNSSEKHDFQSVPAELAWQVTPGGMADAVLARAVVAAGDDVRTEQHAVMGDPTETLLKVADEVGADLLVVGNQGMGGVTGFVRPTVPNKISHRATCDVLIVATRQTAA
jgi:nucleotide-binding universal stress UspA family protein